MFALLLVACGVPESADSASDVDVSVAPIYLSKTWPYGTLNNGGDTLSEPYGTVYLVNYGTEPAAVEVLATSTGDRVSLDKGPTSWLDVSPSEDLAFTMQPGQQSEVQLWAYGRIWDGDELELGVHTFHPAVTVDGTDTAISAELILETAD
jgi:hypothetical protein